VGRGGIREVEFFVQTQQLIAGGRQPELRVSETLAALDRLEQRGWIAAGVGRGAGAVRIASCARSSIACR
jgi:glutamate-ammonia-ligase adenylyltransferase